MRMTDDRIKAILKYPGAKTRLAPWIVSFFPEHDIYLEPFCGSAAVLLAKTPCRQETINDINDEVVNLFSVLRNKEKAERLSIAIALTPYAESKECLFDDDCDDVEKARRYVAKTNMHIGGGQKYSSGFKHSVKANGPQCPYVWSRMPEQIRKVSQRLKDVYIRKRDALELIRRYDIDGSLIYVDPPYPISCRKKGLYLHEMQDSQHLQLVEILREIKFAKIIVSGYDYEPYSTGLSGWHKEKKSTRAESAAERTEILWMNFDPQEGG